MAVALGACQPDRITTEDPVVTFDTEAWAGNTLVLRSASFRGTDTLPTVTVGSDTLPVRSFGSDSVLVQLPDSTGWISLAVHLAGGSGGPVGEVRLYGFAGAGAGPHVDGPIRAWPGGGVPTVLAIQNGRLVRIDLRTNSAAPLLPDTGLSRSGCLYPGPMPSAVNPGVVVVAKQVSTGCGPLVAVPVAPGVAAPDTGPPPWYYSAVQLARGSWLVASHHYVVIKTGSVATGFVSGPQIAIEAPDNYAISPRGDRVVPTLGYSYAGGGMPVFDPARPGVAYYLTGLPDVANAIFSDGGDTLYVTGWGSSGDAELRAVDAATGRLLARTATRAAGGDIALDPVRPYLYVAGAVGDAPVVEVFDRASLALVATLRMPPGRLPFDPRVIVYSDFVTVMYPSARQLFVVVNPWGDTAVLRFDLMP